MAPAMPPGVILTGTSPAWVTSIQHAADALRATGVEQLCFVGLRLGATLATLAALERKDVAGLALIAPIVNAKATCVSYARCNS